MGKELEQVVREIFTPARVKYPTRPVVVKSRNDLCQLDLCEMTSLAKENYQKKLILTFVNAFTKYAHAAPLADKKSSTVTKAAEKMFDFQEQLLGAPMRLCQVDGGSEFKGEFARMCKKKNIHLYTTFSERKASLVERFNRTLKTRIFKSFLLRSSLNWVDELDKIVDSYNNTKHRTTGMTPKAASERKHETFLLETVYWKKNNRPRGVAKFKVGDAVRISRKSHIFNRGYTPQFSVEVFFVSSVNNKLPITYLLRDHKHEPILGAVYQSELTGVQRPDVHLVERVVRRDKKRRRVLVKWVDYEEPTWEPEDNFKTL